MSQWKVISNLLATDAGDLTTLTTSNKTSLVGAINELQTTISSLVIAGITLPNNTWFPGGANPSGTVNILKVGTDNKLYFGANIKDFIIEGGVINALTSPLPIAAGGTNAVTAPAARTSLGLAIGTNVQAWNVQLDQISAISPVTNDFIVRGASSWVNQTPTQVRSTLGLAIGTNIQGYSAHLESIAAINPAANTFIVATGDVGLTTAYVGKDPAAVRTTLGLVIGTNVQAFSANLASIAGLTPSLDSFILGSSINSFAIRDASYTRTALGLVIGTDVQAFSSRLSNVAGITPASGTMIIGNGTAFVGQTPSQIRTSLALQPGVDVLAYDSDLQTIGTLAATQNNFLVGGAGNIWSSVTPLNARIAIGLRLPADSSPTVLAYSTSGNSLVGLAPVAADYFPVATAANTYGLKTASQVGTILGLVVGSTVQAFSSKLANIASYTTTDGYVLMGNGTTYVLNTPAVARQKLGVRTRALDGAGSAEVQDYSTRLYEISQLSAASGNVLIGSGGSWIVQSGGSFRSSIGAAASGVNGDITSLGAVGSVSSPADLYLSAGAAANMLFITDGTVRLQIDSSNNFQPWVAAGMNLGSPSKYFNAISVQTINFAGSHGTSGQNPATASPNSWAQVLKGGTIYYIPLYT